jgi:hypothetical protein
MLTPEEADDRGERIAALCGRGMFWASRIGTQMPASKLALKLTDVANDIDKEIKAFARDVRD